MDLLSVSVASEKYIRVNIKQYLHLNSSEFRPKHFEILKYYFHSRIVRWRNTQELSLRYQNSKYKYSKFSMLVFIPKHDLNVIYEPLFLGTSREWTFVR